MSHEAWRIVGTLVLCACVWALALTNWALVWINRRLRRQLTGTVKLLDDQQKAMQEALQLTRLARGLLEEEAEEENGQGPRARKGMRRWMNLN